MRKNLFTLSLMVGIVGISFGQELLSAQLADKVHYAQSGSVKNISFNKSANVSIDQTENLFRQIDQTTIPVVYMAEKSSIDDMQVRHDEYVRMYKGIPVEFEVYKVHSKDGIILSANGEFSKLELDSHLPNFISKSQALDFAKQSVGAIQYAWEVNDELYVEPEPELVILPASFSKDKKAMYVFKIDVYALNPLSREYIYVDAKTGDIVFKDPIIKHIHGREANHTHHHNGDHHHQETFSSTKNETLGVLATGIAETRYSGEQHIETTLVGDFYQLKDQTRNIEILNMNSTVYKVITPFEDEDNFWSREEYDNVFKDNAALDAHYGLTKTYDFFKEKFGRNSYDGNGSKLLGYVHYGEKVNNAFWSGSHMIYGDGTYNSSIGAIGYDALTSLDVTAHEVGHGVCQTTARLLYQRESGALNEAFSDIWGAAVEYFSAPDDTNKNPWLIAEEIDKRPNSIAMRSLKNPKAKNQPDTYKGQYWKPATVEECPVPDRMQNDHCGVHTNSGVLNYWFYILTEGDSGVNDKQQSYDVAGIGWDKSIQITYCAEANYATYNSDYEDIREYTITCAQNLYGVDSVESLTVQNAWYAVGIGEQVEMKVNDVKEKAFIVYPNPVKDFIYVKTQDETTFYTLYNLSGQIVAQGKLTNGQIDAQRLPSGVYVLKLDNQKDKLTSKIIKH